MATDRSDETLRLRATLATIAPGTALRDGLERILRGRTGALIVLGHDKIVESIATGGFTLDVPFTATGLRELAKMDGAIILDKDVTRILRAAVHLMPDHTIPSEETGTRHRTADRVARQTGFPVISVSQSMQIIAAYVGATRHVLEDSGQILSRANQALATLERYKLRLDEVSSTLSALEIEDLVTVRDVAVVAQRLEMVTRIASEIEDYVLELGTDGRLLSLQLEELITGVDTERELVIRDYLPAGRRSKTPEPAAEPPRVALLDRARRPRRRGPGPRPRQRRAPRRCRRAPRLPAARQGPAAAQPRSSTGSSTTSAPCRSCCPRASTTCRPSTASASCAPAASARACPGSRSRRSSSGTSEHTRLVPNGNCSRSTLQFVTIRCTSGRQGRRRARAAAPAGSVAPLGWPGGLADGVIGRPVAVAVGPRVDRPGDGRRGRLHQLELQVGRLAAEGRRGDVVLARSGPGAVNREQVSSERLALQVHADVRGVRLADHEVLTVGDALRHSRLDQMSSSPDVIDTTASPAPPARCRPPTPSVAQLQHDPHRSAGDPRRAHLRGDRDVRPRCTCRSGGRERRRGLGLAVLFSFCRLGRSPLASTRRPTAPSRSLRSPRRAAGSVVVRGVAAARRAAARSRRRAGSAVPSTSSRRVQ